MPAVPRCDLCDLPLDQCVHGGERPMTRGLRADRLEVSPRKIAHLPGCQHKGDDDDYSMWGMITIDPMAAWQDLGNGNKISCDSGSQPDLIADQRCRTCENR